MKNIFYVLILTSIAGAGWWVFAPHAAVAPVALDEEATMMDTQPLPTDSIVGVWRSTEDANFVRTVYENGGYMDSYDGTPDATTQGPWVTFTKDNAPDGFAYPLEDGATYLQLTAGEETLNFKIAEVTQTQLTLIYLDRGGSLNFVRE